MVLVRRPRDERGAVAIIVAVLSVVLFVLAALVVDLGQARDRSEASQVSSDAAALAGGTALYQTGGSTGCSVSPCFAQAVAAVEAYTAKNLPGITAASWSGCTDPHHYYVYSGTLPSGTVATSCISFADDDNLANSTQPTKVRVLTPQVAVKTGLGNVAGVSTIDVQTAARAQLPWGTARSCGLCMLGAVASDVGNGDVTVSGASIHTNGSFDVGAQGTVTVTTDTADREITTTAAAGCSQNCDPAAVYAPTMPDPYASLSLPPSDMPHAAKTDPCSTSASVGGPGVYSAAITLPKGACNLQPGMYVITGSWTAGNNTQLTGTGVTLYFACGGATPRACSAPGEAGGFLDMKNGTAGTSVTSPLSAMTTGSLAGFVVVYDKYDDSPLGLQGNGDTYYAGTVYAPSSQMNFPGNSTIHVVNGPIVVSSLYSNGNKASMELTSAVGASVPVPSGAPHLDQ